MALNPNRRVTPRTLQRAEWPPDYVGVNNWKKYNQLKFVDDVEYRKGAVQYYRTHPWEFINHWCVTYDPRNAGGGDTPSTMPFVLFQRQQEYIQFLYALVTAEQSGIVDKSRDMGATWLSCAFSVWLWLFKPGSSVGWGSRKEDLVDRIGDPDSIFEKMRIIIRNLPPMFWPIGFNERMHFSHMRILNPETGSSITGEAGSNIGRGGRKLIYFKDESAHYEHPEAIEAALGDNTRIQVDISTPFGVGTVYDRKRDMSKVWIPGDPIVPGNLYSFIFDWSDHPAKDEAWYKSREKDARDKGLLHLFRQEVDRDPAASLTGIIIPAEWIKAAVDAHLKLDLDPIGLYIGGFDPYDQGGDRHAFAIRKGLLLMACDEWAEGDTGDATRFVIQQTAGTRPIAIQYDSVGIGAGVKTEVNRLIREEGTRALPDGVTFFPWDGGDKVQNPSQRFIPGDVSTPKNEDIFGNLKAQGWWELRMRFEKTYRMVNEKDRNTRFPPEQLISLSSEMPRLRQLIRELSQPVRKMTASLQIIVDKKPEGAMSPNLADACMMAFFPRRLPMDLSPELLMRAATERPHLIGRR